MATTETRQAMHRDPVADFEHVTPGDRISWYHGMSNRDQWGYVVAWTPRYRINAVGEVICVEAHAVIQADEWSLNGRQVVEVFSRYGSGIKWLYR